MGNGMETLAFRSTLALLVVYTLIALLFFWNVSTLVNDCKTHTIQITLNAGLGSLVLLSAIYLYVYVSQVLPGSE